MNIATDVHSVTAIPWETLPPFVRQYENKKLNKGVLKGVYSIFLLFFTRYIQGLPRLDLQIGLNVSLNGEGVCAGKRN